MLRSVHPREILVRRLPRIEPEQTLARGAIEQIEQDQGDGTGTKDPEEKRVGLYRRIVLADLLREREGRLMTLRRQGLSVLDVPPSEATASTLNRYMELRYGVG